MIRSIYLILLLLSGFTAFAQGKLNKGFKTFKVYPDKRVQFNQDDSFSFSAQIVKGDMLVFEYFSRADEYADMTDDEFVETLLFEIPKNSTAFELSGNALRAAYLRGCFCVDRGWHQIRQGVIKGKKINSKTWEVEISVDTDKEPDRSAPPIAIDMIGKYVLQPSTKAKAKPAVVPKKPAPKKVMILKKK